MKDGTFSVITLLITLFIFSMVYSVMNAAYINLYRNVTTLPNVQQSANSTGNLTVYTWTEQATRPQSNQTFLDGFNLFIGLVFQFILSFVKWVNTNPLLGWSMVAVIVEVVIKMFRRPMNKLKAAMKRAGKKDRTKGNISEAKAYKASGNEHNDSSYSRPRD